MLDITPRLLRLALREVMADTRRSIESMAETLNMSAPDLRCWLNTPREDWVGQVWMAHVDRIIDRYLARVESKGAVKAAVVDTVTKKCPKCHELKPLTEFYSSGYCKQCAKQIAKARYHSKKLELAAAV